MIFLKEMNINFFLEITKKIMSFLTTFFLEVWIHCLFSLHIEITQRCLWWMIFLEEMNNNSLMEITRKIMSFLMMFFLQVWIPCMFFLQVWILCISFLYICGVCVGCVCVYRHITTTTQVF